MLCSQQVILSHSIFKLKGNETASIFAWWIVKNMKSTENGVKELSNSYILSSTVSTRLPATIARMEGLQFEETLTGFKWMGNRATQLAEMGHKVRGYR